VKRAVEQSQFYEGLVDSASLPVDTEKSTWIHHTDGYHYKKFASGAFDSVPHKKNADGTYAPYQP
jgi:hypothetical protein